MKKMLRSFENRVLDQQQKKFVTYFRPLFVLVQRPVGDVITRDFRSTARRPAGGPGHGPVARRRLHSNNASSSNSAVATKTSHYRPYSIRPNLDSDSE